MFTEKAEREQEITQTEVFTENARTLDNTDKSVQKKPGTGDNTVTSVHKENRNRKVHR